VNEIVLLGKIGPGRIFEINSFVKRDLTGEALTSMVVKVNTYPQLNSNYKNNTVVQES
jgi:hypothetical protein